MDEQPQTNFSSPAKPPSKSKVFLNELWVGEISPVVKHTVYMCSTILGIFIFEKTHHVLLGPNAMLFGRIPYDYVGHFGDLFALANYLRHMWKGFK